MKQLILFTILSLLTLSTATSQDNNSGNQNICKPVVNINTCKKCDTCQAPKTKTKIVYKTKKVYVPGPVVTKTEVKEKRVYIKRKPRKNRIKLLAGYGLSGVDAERLSATRARAFTENGFVGGLGYERLITDRFSLGIQVQTNETYMGSVGFDF